MVTANKLLVHLRKTDKDGVHHVAQESFIDSKYKRIVIKAGRRGGKTVGIAQKAVKVFLAGDRVLYAAPTIEQVDAFWFEVCRALREPIEAGRLRKNESEHTIELVGTKQRIKAKTAWNADTLRGDYAKLLILDEFQLMNEDSWAVVGQPMLLDNNGDAVFIFTPPSLRSAGVSKAHDPRHASKLFKLAQADTTGLWQAIHFTSLDNPFLSQEALQLAASGMTMDAYRREIMAMDDEIETSWLVLSKFNEASQKIKRFPIPHHWPVYSSHDFGSANPAALFFAQNPGPDEPKTTRGQVRRGDFVLFREYAPGAGLSTFQHVESFKEITFGYKVTRSVGGNLTTEDEIRQGYGSHGWQIMAPRIGRVNAQLDRLIGLLELNKIHIFEDCLGTLGMIANCMWELDEDNHTTNKIRDEAKYHFIACLRYFGSDFIPETIEQMTNVMVQDLRPSHRRQYAS